MLDKRTYLELKRNLSEVQMLLYEFKVQQMDREELHKEMITQANEVKRLLEQLNNIVK